MLVKAWAELCLKKWLGSAMGFAVRKNHGTSGRYMFKRWIYGFKGERLGAVPATFDETPSDLINSCYSNADGSRTVFAISIDLDASRACAEWKKEDGSLDWVRMEPRLKEALPEVERYLAYVTKSSGGLGLSLVFGINPLPLIDSTYTNQQMYYLSQAYLIKAFARLGFGADPAAVGLIRDFPNFMNHERNFVSRPWVFRWLESSVGESHFSALLSASLKFLRAEERKERLYPDSRVEAGLAHLFHMLLKVEGSKDFILQDLMVLTGLSNHFLRKFLKWSPSWLQVTSRGHGKGWALSLDQTEALFDLRKSRAEGLLNGNNFRSSVVNTDVFGLCLPEEVQDGFRNDWLHRIALFYKWHGISEFDCLRKIELRMKFIPEIEKSRNGRNIGSIVGSIYRNHTAHFGKYADLGLPEWMTDDDRYMSKLALRLVTESLPSSHQSIALDERSAKQEVPFSLNHTECELKNGTAEMPQESKISMVGYESLGTEVKTQIGCVLLFSSTGVNQEIAKVDLEQMKSSDVSKGASSTKVQNVVSLQKGCNPLKVSLRGVSERWVGFDAHVLFQGTRYSVPQEFVGECVGVVLEQEEQKIKIIYDENVIETHDIPENFCRRVTKWEHRFFPQRRKVRADGHVLFHGKLYSTGDLYLGRELIVSHQDDVVVIRDPWGSLVAVHDSIQDTSRKVSTLSEHFGPWEKALEYDSYYRVTARNFGQEVEDFVLGVLNKKKGLIDSSLIHRLFKLAANHDRDIFLSLCRDQVQKRDFRLKPLVAILGWLDSQP